MPPQLPPEINDAIIARTIDTETLLSCALVCSDWLPASRHRLFHAISCKHPETYDLLVARVLRSDSMSPWLTSVQHLEFIDAIRRGGTRLDNAHRFIHDFAGRLPNLLVLSLSFVDWTAFPALHPSAYVTFSRLPSLRTLKLHCVRFPSWPAFRRTIAAFPALRELRLDIDYDPWPLQSMPGPDSPCHTHTPSDAGPALESLIMMWYPSLYNTYARHVLRWLAHTRTRLSLARLSMGCFRDGKRAALPSMGVEFLAALGAGELRSLTLFQDFSRPLEHDVDLSGLAACHHLTKLLLYHKPETLYGRLPRWTDVARIVQASPSSLHDIVLQLEMAYGPGETKASSLISSFRATSDKLEEEEAGLEALDAALAHVVFKRRVHFVIDVTERYYHADLAPEPSFTHAQLQEAIQARLPELQKRGVIQVQLVRRTEETDERRPRA